LKVDEMRVKEFRGDQKHSVGDECEMGKAGKGDLERSCLPT